MLKEKTMKGVGEAEAEIFEAHQMLLEDLDFVEGITGMIENDKVNAEYAVFVTGEQCAALFLSMDDDYMRGRAADVNDISSRLIAILSGTQVSAEAMPEPVIIMAEDLAPSETVQFEKDKILALVTQKGSANSHTAILARMMNIPCIVTADIDLDPELTGEVLKVIKGLADQKMTMIIVTHEMAFARDVANQVVFMDNGFIVEQGTPDQVFGHTQEERTRQFLSRFNQR